MVIVATHPHSRPDVLLVFNLSYVASTSSHKGIGKLNVVCLQ